MTNKIELNNCKSYATEENLLRALAKLGLDEYGSEGEMPCKFIVARTTEGRWTAIFLISQYFNLNKTGGYVAFASQHGFMSV